ncbi:Hsp70 family protein [bacterium]|nr:Hsp70 family protein [bacterium]
MEPIIGLDFGNYNSFACFISDFDLGSRMGGIVHDLMPNGLSSGIPSVYFYSRNRGVKCGENAISSNATPIENRLRYLKRHLGETIYLDEKEISYDFAITQVIQHCVKCANRQLNDGWHISTNLISLSYPATYTCAQRQRLIDLAEKATLEFKDEDGNKKIENIKVVGTIAEPAAAALDYLAEFAGTTEKTTVLVYDLGGGTFDLALVSAYPQGKENKAGHKYYYDIINTRGEKVGGKEFDDIMFDLLMRKFSEKLGKSVEELEKINFFTHQLRLMGEGTKVELSSNERSEPEILFENEYISVEVTRKEFEKASVDLLQRTIVATLKIIEDHPNQQPELILLTGGASQMPMVKQALESVLPQFRGKIECHRPSRAIAYGAARFGTLEENTDPETHVVQQRTIYDLGIMLLKRGSSNYFIETVIPAGTVIPCTSEKVYSVTVEDGQTYSRLPVCEAKKAHPNTDKPHEDYVEIMSVIVDHGKPVPKDTQQETRLLINEKNLLTIESREDKQGKPWFKNQVELKHLS